MRVTALRHAEMDEEFATLWTVVSYAAEFTLERSPRETFRMEVVDERIAKF
jgi:hypothetical protein